MGGIGLYGLDGFAVTQLTLKKTNISYCKQKNISWLWHCQAVIKL